MIKLLMIGSLIIMISDGYNVPKLLIKMAWPVFIAFCMAVFLLMIFLTGCAAMNDGAFTEETAKLNCCEEVKTYMENENKVSKMARPAIDMAVPSELETATLAMG
jgi:hypothetical protein